MTVVLSYPPSHRVVPNTGPPGYCVEELVVTKRGKNPGTESWQFRAYFQTVVGCALWLLRKEAEGVTAGDVTTLTNEWARCCDRVVEAVAESGVV